MSAGVCRRAVPADQAVLVQYNRTMAKETENLDLAEAVVSRGVAAVLMGQAGATYYVVEVGGQVVAQLMITLEWSDWRAANMWWVQSVYVHPDHRQRGLFRRLYQHVREEARQAGAAGIRLYADDSNAQAHAAYQRLGMSSHYRVFEDMFPQDGS